MTEQPNVLFVVLDTVRADRVSALGYEHETTPTLDEFARDGTLFTDAVSQAPWSVPSHASMFTGEYPRDHGTTTVSPVLSADSVLPEQLSAAGYKTYAVSPNEYVRPATGFGRGFDEFKTRSRLTEPQLLAELFGPAVNWFTSTPSVRRTVERAFNAVRESSSVTAETNPPADDDLLDSVSAMLESASEPFFLFVNLFDAHLPRSPKPEYVEEFLDPELADVPIIENERTHTFGEHEMGPRALEKMSQLYDADLKTLDDRLDALLDCFREAGVLEDSLVVLVSDHGEHLGEFNLVGHQFSVFDSTVSVPLVVKFPDGGPASVDEQVETRRIYHTILDETGVKSYPERSLATGTGDEIARGSYHSPMIDLDALLWDGTVRYDRNLLGEPLRFARTNSEKLICFAGKEWLFGLPEGKQRPISHERAREIYTTLSEQPDGSDQPTVTP